MILYVFSVTIYYQIVKYISCLEHKICFTDCFLSSFLPYFSYLYKMATKSNLLFKSISCLNWISAFLEYEDITLAWKSILEIID